MGKYFKEDELISLLKHSSLPTILVEGKDDVRIYRWLEDDINSSGTIHADILPCGCRNTLLKLYGLRTEFSNVIFIADRDMYVYKSIPSEYSDIVFTTGYSIENDLYHGRGIENLFDKNDTHIFGIALDAFLEYYAREVEKCVNGECFELRRSPQQILDQNYQLKAEYKPQQSPQQKTIAFLKADYDLLLRGHSLFQLLNLVLTRKGRTSKPNMDAIYELCYKCYKSDCIKDLKNRVLSKL
jgi:hypothetical protein